MIATHGTNTTSAHYTRMGQQECEKIHAATLEILERTGKHINRAALIRDILDHAAGKGWTWGE